MQDVDQRIDSERISDSTQGQDHSPLHSGMGKTEHLDQLVVDDAFILVLNDLWIKHALSTVALQVREGLRNARSALAHYLSGEEASFGKETRSGKDNLSGKQHQ